METCEHSTCKIVGTSEVLNSDTSFNDREVLQNREENLKNPISKFEFCYETNVANRYPLVPQHRTGLRKHSS